MKKLLCLVLVFCLCITANISLAQVQFSSNPSTFETFEEACYKRPRSNVGELGSSYVSDPCLAEYPAGTTYIYRSRRPLVRDQCRLPQEHRAPGLHGYKV